MAIPNLNLFSGTVTAEDFNGASDAIEGYLNGGIKAKHLDDHNKFVKTEHIRSPAFFGSPAPRAELVSGEVHYRRGRRGEDQHAIWEQVSVEWEPIESLCATIHVTRNPYWTNDQYVQGNLHASFWTQEVNGLNSSLNDNRAEFEQYVAAGFAAFVNNVYISGSHRHVMCSTKRENRQSSKHINISVPFQVHPGVNNVGIYMKIASYDTENTMQRVHVGVRSFVVETFNL